MSMLDKEAIRAMLPPSAIDDFDDIVVPRVLGATKHIKLIYSIINKITVVSGDLNTCLRNIEDVCVFFKETRGKSSYAIVNALNEFLSKLKDVNEDGYKDHIVGITSELIEEMLKSVDLCVKYARSISKDFKRIMVYDYSSTVDLFIKELDPKIELVVPESRSINGGYPFLKSASLHSRCRYVVDAGMFEEMKCCDAVFIGAETFFPNGDVFNTIGSDVAALIANYFHVPYYVLTPLIKVDSRAIYGEGKSMILKDLSNKIGKDFDVELKNMIDFTAYECVKIDRHFVNSYITEFGIFSPEELLGVIGANKPFYLKKGTDNENQ